VVEGVHRTLGRDRQLEDDAVAVVADGDRDGVVLGAPQELDFDLVGHPMGELAA
jgi:hypothetical protein